MTVPLHLSPVIDETNNQARVMYNGFRFPFARHTTAAFSPEMSNDGRATKYLRLDLHIEFVWIPLTDVYDRSTGHIGLASRTYNKDISTDSTFSDIRRRLNSPGQKLLFIDQGIGNISTQDGITSDVNNGPKPKVVSVKPIAGSRALNVVWECSTWLASCETLFTSPTAFAQFPYSVTWSIDVSGLTIRTINGLVEIPLSRIPNTNSFSALTSTSNSADLRREDLIKFFPRIVGFTRTSQSFTLSEDRKTLNFSIVDQEIPSDNPYFPGIISQKVTRNYSSSVKEGFTKWQGSISGSIEVAPGYDKLRAWTAFATIFEDIFNRRELGHVPATATTNQDKDYGSSPSSTRSSGFINSISISEEIYGRTFTFSIGYYLFCSLQELFKATGLFQPLGISPNDASWQKWKTSLSTIQGDDGWRGLAFDPKADVIVDLCNQPTIPKDPGDRIPSSEQSKKEPGYEPDGPKKDDGFLHASSEFQAILVSGVSYALRLLYGKAQQENPSAKTPSETDSPNINQNDQQSSGTEKKVSLRQIRPNVYKIVYSGKFIRAGFPPPIPELKSVGGVNAFKIGTDSIIQKVLGVGTDVQSGNPLTLYGLSWRKEYILESPPINGSIDADGHIGLYT